jgi:uncharacterized membrane protein YsdA (DUF1294 family)/cold shock CspA family protein
MRFEGFIKTWNDDRGFGFIEADQGGDEVFVHIKSIANLQGRPTPNQRCSFEIELGPQGKKRAKNVMPVRAVTPTNTPAKAPTQTSHARHERYRKSHSPAAWGTATLFAIPVFFVFYGVVAFFWRPPGAVALVYLGLSALTFVVYAADKAAAKRNANRTPESWLHMLALFGGWPGALLAQQVLRHKSSKAEFRSVFWATVVMNIAGFVAFCSPFGRALWRGL